MSIVKVIEILSDSAVSWQDTVKQVLGQVSKTVYNVKSLYIKDDSVKVEDGTIKSYRISAKVRFLLD